jgi:hypothetical protein
MEKKFICILLLKMFFLGLASGQTLPENVENFYKNTEKLVAKNPNQRDAYYHMVSMSKCWKKKY